MRLRNLGKTLFPVLAFLAFSSCRSSKPPAISIICIGDGFGGGDCAMSESGTIPDGCIQKDPKNPLKVYCPPSALKNFWMTTEVDEQNFAQWCYGSNSPGPIQSGMAEIKEQAK